MTSNIIDSLFVALGFEFDTDKLDEFKEKVFEGRNLVLGFGAAMAAASVGILAFVTEQAEGIASLQEFSEQNQVAIETVQELGFAAQQEGSSLDAMKSSIEGLNRVTGEAITGVGRGAKFFAKFGLSAKDAQGNVKNFDEILGDVSDKLQDMSRQAQRSMLTKLGIDPSLVVLLSKGRDNLRELMNEAKAFGVVDQEDADKAREFKDNLERLQFIVTGLSRSIAVLFIPRANAILVRMRQWIMANKEWIKSSIARAAKFIVDITGILVDVLWQAITVMTEGVRWLVQFRGAAYLAGAALAYLVSVLTYQAFAGAITTLSKLTMSVWEFFAAMTAADAAALVIPALIGAVVVAFGLLIDDYMTWKEGGESFIGDLVKQFPWLLGAIETVQKGIAAFAAFWTQQWGLMKGPLGDLAGAVWKLISVLVEALWPAVKIVAEIFAWWITTTLPVVSDLIKLIAEGLTIAIAGIAGTLTVVFNAARKTFEGIIGFIERVIAAAQAVGKWLGIGGGASIDTTVTSNIAKAPALSGGGPVPPAGPALSGARGVIGRAANGNQPQPATIDQSQTTHVGQIIVQSPDPAKAGEAVGAELDKRNKRVTRNGQTGVGL